MKALLLEVFGINVFRLTIYSKNEVIVFED